MRIFLISVLLAFAVVAGCHSSPKPESQSSATQAYKVYKLRGKVVATNSATGEVTVNHDAIRFLAFSCSPPGWEASSKMNL